MVYGLLLAAPARADIPIGWDTGLADGEDRASRDARLMAERHLRSGELHFDGGRTASALAAYRMVPRQSDAYRDAVLGMARCYIKLGALRSALATLSKLAAIADQDALLAVRVDTADKVHLVWTEIAAVAARRGEPDRARKLFRERGDANTMARVAEFYREHDRREDSSEVYRLLTLLDGDTTRTCEWQDEITRNGIGSEAAGDIQAIPELEKGMLDRYVTCVERASQRPDPVEVQYHRARVYYEYDHFIEAQPLFEEIVSQHPEHPRADQAAGGLLASLIGLGKTEAVHQWTDRLLHDERLMKTPSFDARVLSLESEAYDIKGHAFERQRNDKECGRLFQAAADAQPDNPQHAERLWYASLCFERARLVGQALRARQQLIKDHPSHPLAREALFKVAAGYGTRLTLPGDGTTDESGSAGGSDQ